MERTEPEKTGLNYQFVEATKEKIINIVDIMFYVHPNLPEGQRSSIEETISTTNGVMHVNFHDRPSHELGVSYDPDAIKAEALLDQIRKWDSDVKMIGV